MGTLSRHSSGAAVAAVLLQACATVPQQYALPGQSMAATPAARDAAAAGTDWQIARLHADFRKVDELLAQAERLASEARSLPARRECTDDDALDALEGIEPACGMSSEARSKVEHAGRLRTEARQRWLDAWHAAHELALSLRPADRPWLLGALAGALAGAASGIYAPVAPGVRKQMADVDVLIARARSKHPEWVPGSSASMGDALHRPPPTIEEADRSAAGTSPEAVGTPPPAAARDPETSVSRSPGHGDIPAKDQSPPQAARSVDSAEEVLAASRLEPHATRSPQPNEGSFQAIDGVIKGSAAVSAPATAKSGETFFVFLRVKPDRIEAVTRSMREDYPGNKQVTGKPNVELTARMTARVSGAGFKVTPQGEETQLVSATEATTWEWEVEALRSGVHILTFTLTGAVVKDGEAQVRNLYSYRQEVKVAVGIWALVQEKWEWVVATLVLPGIGFAWKEWTARKSAGTTAQPGLVERLRRRRRLQRMSG